VVQAVKGGRTRVADVPAPSLRAGGVLVRTRWSLISAGTEKLIIELAGKSLVGKARARPELTGLASTYRASSQQLRADVDREKTTLLGIPIQDVYSAIQAQFGSLPASQFNAYAVQSLIEGHTLYVLYLEPFAMAKA